MRDNISFSFSSLPSLVDRCIRSSFSPHPHSSPIVGCARSSHVLDAFLFLAAFTCSLVWSGSVDGCAGMCLTLRLRSSRYPVRCSLNSAGVVLCVREIHHQFIAQAIAFPETLRSFPAPPPVHVVLRCLDEPSSSAHNTAPVFVALMTSPAELCSFQSYVNSFEEDTAPESAAIIPADVSPSGYPLLVAAYEESNTVAVFELKFDE